MIRKETRAHYGKKNSIKDIYGTDFLFLYLPIVVLIVLSFNNSKSKVKWGGFTLDWYIKCFQSERIMSAFSTTLQITLLAAVISTIIGTLAAMGISAMKKRNQTIYLGATNIPMLNADIVTGISLMLLFIAVGSGLKYLGINFSLGFATVLIAHITFNIPYVILSVMPKLKQTKRSTYEAALDLAHLRFTPFLKLYFRIFCRACSQDFCWHLPCSLDDFVITHFTKGPGVDTLSTKIYSEVRKGIKPEMYALSTLLFVSVLILLILINVSPNKKGSTDKTLNVKNLRKPFTLYFAKLFRRLWQSWSLPVEFSIVPKKI